MNIGTVAGRHFAARSRRSVAAALAVAAATAGLTLAACASGTAPPAGGSTSASNSAASQTTYPVVVEDCGGRKTTYDRAPSRVVTIDPSVTEMLLVLGLKDRIVGYTEFFTADQRWSATKDDMASLHQINDGSNYPSKEAVVAASPDLVTSVYSYAFGDPLPNRDGWTKLGVKSYQSLGECTTDKPPSDFSLLYDDLRNFGIIFDVQDKATAEIAKLKAHVGELMTKVGAAARPVARVAIADGTAEHPPTYGGTAEALLSLAGARFIFAGLAPDQNPTWEQFVKDDPTIIWVIPDAGKTVADIEQQLQNDPRLKTVTAVRNRAYVVVPQADATIESPRNIDGLAKFIDGLLALS